MEPKQVKTNRDEAMSNVSKEAERIANEGIKTLNFMDKLKAANNAYHEEEKRQRLIEAHQYNKIVDRKITRIIFGLLIAFILYF